MRLKVSLSESDYLTHQLYIISRNEKYQKRLKKRKYISSIFFLIISILFYELGSGVLATTSLLLAIAYVTVIPMYTKWYAENRYREYVVNTYSKFFDVEESVVFNRDHIFAKDAIGTESKIDYSLFDSINQLPNHFLFRLSENQSLIIPKISILDSQEFDSVISKVSSDYDIAFINDTDWKW